MSGESEWYQLLREGMSPEQIELDKWLYDFTKEHWRSTLLLGYLQATATQNPQLGFLEALRIGRQFFGETADTDTSPEAHKARHIFLHRCLDELLADFITHNRRPDGSIINGSILTLMRWSYQQTRQATEVPKDRPN